MDAVLRTTRLPQRVGFFARAFYRFRSLYRVAPSHLFRFPLDKSQTRIRTNAIGIRAVASWSTQSSDIDRNWRGGSAETKRLGFDAHALSQDVERAEPILSSWKETAHSNRSRTTSCSVVSAR
jgi:hypothetical protein